MADSNQDKDIFKDRDHAGRKHFVERVHIGGDACHQPADRVLVVISDVHALQVAEDFRTQIEHRLLPGPLHVIGLEKFQQEADGERANVQSCDLRDTDNWICRLRKRSNGERSPGTLTRYRSTAIFVRYGPRTSAPAFRKIEIKATVTCQL